MNIKNIKNRADELLVFAKPAFVRILMIMLLINLIPTLFTNDGGFGSLLTILVSIIFVTFDHGVVVSSLKVVRNNYLALKDDDAWVGFKRYKELFPTYLLINLIVFAIIFVGIIFMMMIVLGSFSGATQFSNLANLAMASSVLFGVLLIVIIMCVLVYMVSLYLFAAPYLLEQYHIETSRAIKESISFMKGHKMELFKLELSYIGWQFVEIMIISILLNVLPFLGTLIATFVGGLFGVFTYRPQYEISKAIFFEEIAYQRYGGQPSQQDVKQDEQEDEKDVVNHEGE